MIHVASTRDVAHRLQWDHQVTDLTEFVNKIFARTMPASEASDGPPAAYRTDVHNTKHMVKMRDEAQQAGACERTNLNST